MYLGAGVAPVVEMRKRGITVSLAVDGAASNNSQDMLEILKQTGLMHKGFYKDPSIIDAGEVLDMATIGGAKAIGREEDLGSLELGKIADMFIYDPVHPRSVPVLNPVESLVFSSGQENIKTVLIGGNPVMENYVIKTVDENQILAESQVAADALSKRAGTMKLRRKQL
jgi:5-methylthioadenosine/S-adenosylhomocysteine deaminase